MIWTRLLTSLRSSPFAALLVVGSVALATALAGAAAVLGAQLIASSGVLYDQQKVPHLVQMHAGDIDRPALDAFVAAHPEITEFTANESVGLDSDTLEFTPGTPVGAGIVEYTVMTQHQRMDVLTGLDGRPVVVRPGQIGVPVDIADRRGLTPGDPLRIGGHDYTVGPLFRDAIMGSDVTSSRRLLAAEADLPALRQSGTGTEWLLTFRLDDPGKAGQVHDAYLAAGLPAAGPAVDLTMFRLMNSIADGLSASAMLIVAGLLALIAALVLSITVRTAISAELTQVGVLRAIGLPRRALRGIVLTRHVLLVAVGAALGGLIALAAAPAVTNSIRTRMGGDLGALAVLAVAVVVAAALVGSLLIVHAVFRPALRRSPLDVMRGHLGPPGRARTRAASTQPSWWVLGRRQLGVARTDHLTLAALLFTALLVESLPVTLYTSLTAPNFPATTGIAPSDVRVDLRQDDTVSPRLATLEDTLAGDQRISRVTTLTTTRVQVQDPDHAWTGINVESGDHEAFPLHYLQGRAPRTADEIALSELNATSFDAAPGSTISAKLGDREATLTITGVYRDITNGGRTAKGHLPAGVGTPMWTVVLMDVTDPAQLPAVHDDYAALAAPARVTDAAAARQDIFGGMISASRTLAVAAAALAVGLVLVLSALILRLFLVRGQSRRAVAQSIGRPLADIRREFGVRLLLPATAGVLTGALLSPWLGAVLLSLAGRTLGSPSLPLTVNPWLTGLVLPVVLLATVAIVVRLGVTRVAPNNAARLVAGQDI